MTDFVFILSKYYVIADSFQKFTIEGFKNKWISVF